MLSCLIACCLCVCLSVCLSVSQSVCVCLSVHPSIRPSVRMSIRPSVRLPACLCPALPRPPACLPACLSVSPVYVSVGLSVCQSTHLNVYRFMYFKTMHAFNHRCFLCRANQSTSHDSPPQPPLQPSTPAPLPHQQEVTQRCVVRRKECKKWTEARCRCCCCIGSRPCCCFHRSWQLVARRRLQRTPLAHGQLNQVGRTALCKQGSVVVGGPCSLVCCTDLHKAGGNRASTQRAQW